MTSSDEATARIYREKAFEFLSAAEVFQDDAKYVNVMFSLACVSGIASASAILTARNEQRAWGQHDERIKDLNRIGELDSARNLAVLLAKKNAAQYYPKRVGDLNSAARALDAASRLYERALEVASE